MQNLRSKTSGVYKITCTPSGEIYVGATKNIEKRWNGHRYTLRQGKHPNKQLQEAWGKHGENAFNFEIVEKCEPKKLKERERWHIETLNSAKNGFNTADRTESYPKRENDRSILMAISPSGELIKILQVTKFAEQHGLVRRSVYNAIQSGMLHKGWYFYYETVIPYEDDSELPLLEQIRRQKKVIYKHLLFLNKLEQELMKSSRSSNEN